MISTVFSLILWITVDLEKVSGSGVEILYLKIRINHTVKIMCFSVCIDQSTRARLKLTQLASFENRFIHENYQLEWFEILYCFVTHVTHCDTIDLFFVTWLSHYVDHMNQININSTFTCLSTLLYSTYITYNSLNIYKHLDTSLFLVVHFVLQ